MNSHRGMFLPVWGWLDHFVFVVLLQNAQLAHLYMPLVVSMWSCPSKSLKMVQLEGHVSVSSVSFICEAQWLYSVETSSAWTRLFLDRSSQWEVVVGSCITLSLHFPTTSQPQRAPCLSPAQSQPFTSWVYITFSCDWEQGVALLIGMH